MNPTVPTNHGEARWVTYLRAAAFSLPALAILVFSSVFFFPKLETIWRDAGFHPSGFMLSAIHGAYFIRDQFLIVATATAAILVFLELRSQRWARYRRPLMGVAAFVTNTAILIFITILFMTVLLAAPGLIK